MNSEMHDDAGHLSALGWTTFALYLVAALLSFRAAASVRSQSSAIRSQQSSETGRVWIWLGIILAALGLNKQLDLQTRLIELGRQIAGAEHLLTNRAGLHVLFFLGFILAIIALLTAFMLRFSAGVGRVARQLPLAAGGCVLVCAYVVIRAASIDRVDQMMGFDFERIPFLWLLEAGGLLLIIVQALRNPPHQPPGSAGVPPARRKSKTGTRRRDAGAPRNDAPVQRVNARFFFSGKSNSKLKR